MLDPRDLKLAALLAPCSLSLLWGCMSPVMEQPEAAALGDPGSFVLAQASIFRERDRVVAKSIEYGFTNERGAPWEGTTQVEVTYTDGVNDEVQLPLPEGQTKTLLAYRIHFATPGDERGLVTEDRYVHLSSPGGLMVQLPLYNDPSYPYVDACYSASVHNVDDGIGATVLPGKVKRVFYAFTFQSVDQYRQFPTSITWWNGSGVPVAEGILDAHHEPEAMGSRRGMYPMYVRVPAGMSLVYRLELERFDGQCMTQAAPATSLGTTESPLFFLPRAESPAAAQ